MTENKGAKGIPSHLGPGCFPIDAIAHSTRHPDIICRRGPDHQLSRHQRCRSISIHISSITRTSTHKSESPSFFKAPLSRSYPAFFSSVTLPIQSLSWSALIPLRIPFPTVVLPGGGRLAIYPTVKTRYPGPNVGAGPGVS